MSKITKNQPAAEQLAIIDIIKHYFDGLHHANVTLLEDIFHTDCVLKAPGIRRTRNQWLKLVAEREAPALRNDPYAYEIISLEIEGDQAMVKVFCPLLGASFFDYLGLLREENTWKIVSKMYANAKTYGKADTE